MEWSISARASRPRSLFPASRSQMPAPKSTPPAVLYAVMARRSTKAIPSGIGVEPPWPRSVWHADLPRRRFAGVLSAPARAEPQEQRHEEVGDHGVEGEVRDVGLDRAGPGVGGERGQTTNHRIGR